MSTGSSAIVREVLVAWAAAFFGIVTAKLVSPAIPFAETLGLTKAVAALLFLWLPARAVQRRGELLEDYGVPPYPWTSPEAASQFRRDVAVGLAWSIVVLGLFTLGYYLLVKSAGELPPELRRLFLRGKPEVALRLPPDLLLRVVDQFLVVALPEEVFFRGYVQTRLKHAWGGGSLRVFGVALGPYFWVTQALFALAHLAELNVLQLSTFFPAILFGFLREKTGSVVPAIVLHALSNLVLTILNRSFFG